MYDAFLLIIKDLSYKVVVPTLLAIIFIPYFNYVKICADLSKNLDGFFQSSYSYWGNPLGQTGHLVTFHELEITRAIKRAKDSSFCKFVKIFLKISGCNAFLCLEKLHENNFELVTGGDFLSLEAIKDEEKTLLLTLNQSDVLHALRKISILNFK